MGIALRQTAQNIPTQVKNQDLVQRRRRQIVDAAVELFIQIGFHKTTTRQIAKAAGVSIGSLYEYVATKDDVLYLVCDAIHAEMERGMADALQQVARQGNALAEVIREYLLVCDRMSDHILLIYQETQSLPSQWQKRVLENELRITGLFVEALAGIANSDDQIKLAENNLELAAHNIVILGHMWTFRRWYLGHHYSIEDYIQLQTDIILRMFAGGQKSF